jgi:hypothetical protein
MIPALPRLPRRVAPGPWPSYEKGWICAGTRRTRCATGRLAAGVTLAASLVLCLAACAYSGPSDTFKRLTAVDQGRPYIGMTKSEVLACAGPPHSRYGSGPNSETLTYHYNGDGPVPQSGGAKKKSSSGFLGFGKKNGGGDWTCTASLVFENDKLVRVSYANKDVRSPYQWQQEKDPKKREELKEQPVPTCNFSLPLCRRG